MRRGPSESNRTCENDRTRELSMPIAQMCLMTGSGVGNESAGGSGYAGSCGWPPRPPRCAPARVERETAVSARAAQRWKCRMRKGKERRLPRFEKTLNDRPGDARSLETLKLHAT